MVIVTVKFSRQHLSISRVSKPLLTRFLSTLGSIFWGPAFFWIIAFSDQDFFWIRILFDPNFLVPTFFWTKDFLEQSFFWTYICLDWPFFELTILFSWHLLEPKIFIWTKCLSYWYDVILLNSKIDETTKQS